MSANIDTTTGQPAMMSYRQNPWHQMGTVVNESVTDHTKALKLAGLDWTVEEHPVYTADVTTIGDESITTNVQAIPGWKHLRRSDTGNLLSVLSDKYEVFQNHEMFECLACIGGQRDMWWETAGALDEGRTVWGLITIPELEIRIGDDVSTPYMLATQGHIGNKTLTIMPTMVRVVCQNTLTMAERASRGHIGLSRGFRIRHTKTMRNDVRDAIAAYGGTLKNFQLTKEAYETLAARPLTETTFTAMMQGVFGTETPDESTRAKNMRLEREDQLAMLLESPTNNVKGTKHTLFSGLQTIVEYIDHFKPTRGAQADETRWKVANFGEGAGLKAKAMTEALALV